MNFDYRYTLWEALRATGDSQPDTIYRQQDDSLPPFEFNEQVVRVFPDMIGRSVPGYWLVTEQVGIITSRFFQPNTRIYDLGCSLGASSLSIHHHLEAKKPEIIAVDNSEAMIDQFQRNLRELEAPYHIQLRCEDIRETKIEKASVVVLNYTLQFLNPQERLALLQKIHNGLVTNGVLLVSEKIRFPKPEVQQKISDWHHDFKRSHGYSEMEISQKRKALENVMIVDTLADHQHRIHQAGFSSMTPWFQCYNFISFLAEK